MTHTPVNLPTRARRGVRRHPVVGQRTLVNRLDQEAQLNASLPTPATPGKPDRPITFTIDGRPFTVKDPSQTAASLLQLAGLDPAGYDLGELHGNNPVPKRYEDDHKIRVKNGDRFVSIRERAAVA